MEAIRGDDWDMASEGKENCTIADIEALPEGQRAELFDGEMVMLASPTTTHQRIIGKLYEEIAFYIKSQGGKCQVIFAPFAVYLKDDGRNYVEPDIVVVCDESKLDDEGCHGAPDWVIEVVSPSSRGLDYERKLTAYMEAGVREYWIVDAERKLILVYQCERQDISTIYHFGDKVKAGIYEDLIIDTTQLSEIRYD